MRRTRIATPSSLQVMQWWRWSVGSSLDHARLELLELLLVVLAHALQQLSVAVASSSSTLESAKPTWIRTQSPTWIRAVLVEEADVHGAADAGDLDLGEAIGLVDDLR